MTNQKLGMESGTQRRQRYARAPSRLSSLSAAKMQLLRYLAECRFLSLPQLSLLARPLEEPSIAAEKSARRHLRSLFDAGLVDVFPVSRVALAPADAPNDPSLLYGSGPNVYAPTARGLDALLRAGMIEAEETKRTYPAYGPKNTLFLAHELQVRDVRVWLERSAAAENSQEVRRWADGNEAALDLKRTAPPFQAKPDAWFVHRVRQDAEGREAVLVGLVEVDRGTERGKSRWAEKLRAYGELFLGDLLRPVTGYRNARVLVLTPNAARRDALAQLIASEIGTAGLAEKFWLAEIAALQKPGLTAPAWRRVGSQELVPLVG